MGGTVSTDLEQEVLACARVLSEHNGGETVVMDLRKLSAWTDFFIITSATSSTHLRGLLRHLEDHLAERELSPLRRPRLAEDEEWCLLDMGDFVVHIMSMAAREFYELEKLWYGAEMHAVSAIGEPQA
jgi:ribosome-associated protein